LKIAEMEAEALGAQAISEVVSSIKSLGNGNRKSIDPGVLQSIYTVSGIVEGKRIQKIEWSAPGRGRRRLFATVNQTVREGAASVLRGTCLDMWMACWIWRTSSQKIISAVSIPLSEGRSYANSAPNKLACARAIT
jgi:hypothetical protein